MRILIVEDDKNLATSMSRALQVHGYAVDAKHDGDSGINAAISNEYDLITLDWNMPQKTGPVIAHELREKGIETPILMITARAQTTDKVTGLNNGADDYLTKPFAVEELIARVRALLRRPKKLQKLQLTAKNLRLDQSRHSVTRDGIDIALTSKEFSLLEHLLINKNNVVSREQLLHHVWGVSNTHTSNRIDAFIKTLRKKIDANSEDPIITTVRGIGYKITD